MEDTIAPNMAPKMFPCLLCGEQFDSRQKVVHHLKFRKCKRNSPRKKNMKPRGEMKALDVNLVKCDDCGKSFLTKRQLLFHKKLRKCKKTVKEPSQKSSVPKMVKHYQCQTCGKIFASNQNYMRHYMGQHGVRRFVCEECGFRFNYQDSLRKHQRLKPSHKRNKVYLCHLCKDTFTNSKCLSSHLDMWHKMQEPPKKKSGEAGDSSKNNSINYQPKNKAVKSFQPTLPTRTPNNKDYKFNSLPTKSPQPTTSKLANSVTSKVLASHSIDHSGSSKPSHPTNFMKPKSVPLKAIKTSPLKKNNSPDLNDTGPSKLTHPGPSKASRLGPTRTAQPGPSSTAQPGPSSTDQPGPSSTAQPGPSSTARLGPCGTARRKASKKARPIASRTALPGASRTARPRLFKLPVAALMNPDHSVSINPSEWINSNSLIVDQPKTLKQSYQQPKKISSHVALKPASTLPKPIITASTKNKAYKSFNGMTIHQKSIKKECSLKVRPVNKAYKSCQITSATRGCRTWEIQKEMLKQMSSKAANSTTTNTSASSSDCNDSADENGYDTQPFVCSDCGATFMLFQSLKLHRQEKHNLVAAVSIKQEAIDCSLNEEKPFICDICNRVFIIEASLIIHRQEAHEGLTKLPETLVVDESLSNKSNDQEDYQIPIESDSFHGHSLRRARKPVSYAETEVDDLVIDSDNEYDAQFPLLPELEQNSQKSYADLNSSINFEEILQASGGFPDCYVPLEKLKDDQIKSYNTWTDSKSPDIKSKIGLQNMTPFQIIQMFNIEVEDFETLNCGICGMGFKSINSKISHMRCHKRSVQCKICKIICTRRSSLKIHFISQHFGKTIFFCEICKQSFDSKTNLKLHKKIHSETRGKGLDCTQCDATFRRQSSLDKHLKQHSNSSLYKCSCGGRFDTKYGRRTHRKTCQGIKNFSFPNCYVALEKLTQGDIDLYTKLPPKDDAGIGDPSKLTCSEILDKYGIQAQEEDLGLSCGICGLFFDTLLEKQCHMRTHKYKNRCKTCKKYFGSVTSLKRHYIAQHLGKKVYKCTYCDKDFSYRGMLNDHLRKHTKDPILKCRYCPIKFITYWSRDKHEYDVHTGIKPYCCKFCQERFLVKNTFYLHQKKCATKWVE